MWKNFFNYLKKKPVDKEIKIEIRDVCITCNGIPFIIKKSQGIKLIIKDSDIDSVPIENLNRNEDEQEYIISNRADLKV